MQQNSEYRLFGETVCNIISKCCKQAEKKYAISQDMVRQVIHMDSSRGLKCGSTTKLYMHNPEFA